MEPDNALAPITKAKQALANARDISDVLEIRDAAVAVQAYAKAKDAHDAFWSALEVKLRAERRAGQFLHEMKENGEFGKGIKSVTLTDLGIDENESRRWQRIAEIPDFLFEEYLSKAPSKSQSGLLSLAVSLLPHVARATGENEWYTPVYIVDAVRELMGSIDVDPASSEVANEIIQASKYYTIEDDGLTQKWEDNIWMNPPYSQPLVTQFCNLLVDKYLMGEIKQACVLVNNATETEFYQNMMEHCIAICFLKGRVKFIDKNGDSTGAPLQGQTILYFGENVRDFSDIFSDFGVVLYAE